MSHSSAPKIREYLQEIVRWCFQKVPKSLRREASLSHRREDLDSCPAFAVEEHLVLVPTAGESR